MTARLPETGDRPRPSRWHPIGPARPGSTTPPVAAAQPVYGWLLYCLNINKGRTHSWTNYTQMHTAGQGAGEGRRTCYNMYREHELHDQQQQQQTAALPDHSTSARFNHHHELCTSTFNWISYQHPPVLSNYSELSLLSSVILFFFWFLLSHLFIHCTKFASLKSVLCTMQFNSQIKNSLWNYGAVTNTPHRTRRPVAVEAPQTVLIVAVAFSSRQYWTTTGAPQSALGRPSINEM